MAYERTSRCFAVAHDGLAFIGYHFPSLTLRHKVQKMPNFVPLKAASYFVSELLCCLVNVPGPCRISSDESTVQWYISYTNVIQFTARLSFDMDYEITLKMHIKIWTFKSAPNCGLCGKDACGLHPQHKQEWKGLLKWGTYILQMHSSGCEGVNCIHLAHNKIEL